MRTDVRQRLSSLIAGDAGDAGDVLRDSRRIGNVLADEPFDVPAQRSVLVAAVDEGILPRIRNATGALSVDAELERLAADFARDRGLTRPAARWAVRSWAWILGVVAASPSWDGDGEASIDVPSAAAPREQLGGFVQQFPPALLDDPSRIRALLHDVCPPSQRREVALLTAAAEAGLPRQLAKRSVTAAEMDRLAGQLQRDRALTAGGARWAVQSWAWIVGDAPIPDGETPASASDRASVPPTGPPSDPSPGRAAARRSDPAAGTLDELATEHPAQPDTERPEQRPLVRRKRPRSPPPPVAIDEDERREVILKARRQRRIERSNAATPKEAQRSRRPDSIEREPSSASADQERIVAQLATSLRGVLEWYRHVLRQYATFSGRAGRREYWSFTLVNTIVVILLAAIEWAVTLETFVLAALYFFGVLPAALAVAARRLHDSGRTGWWLTMLLVPYVGAVAVLVLLLLRGDAEANRHGRPPEVAAAARHPV